MISSSAVVPGAGVGLGEGAGAATRLPYGDDEGEVWLIADPSRGFAVGAEVARPDLFLGRFGLCRIDGIEVLVERVPIADAGRYVEDHLQGLLS